MVLVLTAREREREREIEREREREGLTDGFSNGHFRWRDASIIITEPAPLE